MSDAPREEPSGVARLVVAALGALLGVAFVAACASHLDLIRVESSLARSDFRPYRGAAYTAKYEPFALPFVAAPIVEPGPHEGREPTGLRLLVNGRVLREEQSTIDEVSELGEGRYLQSASHIIFSDATGADPLETEDHYAVSAPVRVSPLLIALLGVALLALVVGRHGLSRWLQELSPRRVALAGSLAICGLGVGLLLLGAIGAALPLRNSEIYSEKYVGYGKRDITLTETEALELAQQRPDENELDYARRLNEVVNRGVAHYWWIAGADRYRLRIPVWENFFLYFASFFDPSYRRYTIADHRKALERGVGSCGQQSAILTGFLLESGIDARIVNLRGHTVVTANLEGEGWHVLDPDFGIHVPKSLQEIEQDPDALRPLYIEKLEADGLRRGQAKATAERIVRSFDAGGNQVVKLKGFFGGPRHGELEELTYRLKWLVPLLLAFAGGICAAWLSRTPAEARG